MSERTTYVCNGCDARVVPSAYKGFCGDCWDYMRPLRGSRLKAGAAVHAVGAGPSVVRAVREKGEAR